MTAYFDYIDISIFLFILSLTMLIGFIASRNENTSDDFFLGGRAIRWWGVAGSIFGTNVSATHIVGMLGVGYSIGFAQSHYEFGAIPALLLLAYIFLPVYNKLGITTLSEYLELRYDSRCRLAYSIILIVLIILQMTASFYIGSRSMSLLFKGTSLETDYITGIIIMALIAAGYTVFGGLKAVVWTDVLQSGIIIIGSIIICYFIFSRPEVGGWAGLMQKESLMSEGSRMRLYLPSDHPDLPFSGAFSGLIMLHFFYWGTNQYLVQRALGAVSEKEARTGIIFASFLKLLIPFLSIASGVAAYHYFKSAGLETVILPDTALPELLGRILPAGFGLAGLIASAILGAILSSIDSMMNSASTLFTLDVYKKYINRNSDDRTLIRISQYSILALTGISMISAMIFFGPDYKGSFVLKVSALSSYLTPGIVVVFLSGILSRRVSPNAAFAAILSAPFTAAALEILYNNILTENSFFRNIFGIRLNFMHRVALTIGATYLLLAVISRFSERDPEKENLNWIDMGDRKKSDIINMLTKIAVFIIFQILFTVLAIRNLEEKHWFSLSAFLLTMGIFIYNIFSRNGGIQNLKPSVLFKDDRFYAGLLASITSSMLLYFL